MVVGKETCDARTWSGVLKFKTLEGSLLSKWTTVDTASNQYRAVSRIWRYFRSAIPFC